MLLLILTGWLALHFYLHQNLQHWKEQLQDLALQETGLPLKITDIELNNNLLKPQLKLKQLYLDPESANTTAANSTAPSTKPDYCQSSEQAYTHNQEPAPKAQTTMPTHFSIDEVSLGLNFTALLRPHHKILNLTIDNICSQAWRDAAGQWSIAGQAIASGDSDFSLTQSLRQLQQEDWFNWLDHLEITMRHLAIRVRDDKDWQQSQDILLPSVSLWRHQQKMRLTAQAQAPLMGPEPLNLVIDAQLPQKDQPLTLESQLSWSDIRLQNLHTGQADIDAIEDLHLGPGTLEMAWSNDELQFPIRLKGHIKRFSIGAYELFRHGFALTNMNYRLQIKQSHDLWQVLVDDLYVQDPKLQAHFQGDWQALAEHDDGRMKLQGSIKHLDLPFLPTLFPTTMEKDALDWLDNAFKSGYMYDGKFIINGLVDDFPYENSEQGFADIQAKFKQLQLDFSPANTADDWPDIYVKQGYFQFKQDQISLQTPLGYAHNKTGKRVIDFHDLKARIESLNHNAQVYVNAQAHTELGDFLALSKQTPLSRLLDHNLDNAQASGKAMIPLALKIPVMDSDSTEVDGVIHVSDASFLYDPVYPKVTHLQAEMPFNEHWLQVKTARFNSLGGKGHMQGYIGRANHSLDVNASFTAQGLGQFLQMQTQNLMQGSTQYHLNLAFNQVQQIKAQLHADLKGLALKLPGDLHKAAVIPLPIFMQWNEMQEQVGKGKALLQVDIGKGALQGLFERLEGKPFDQHQAYFHRVAVGIDQPAQLGASPFSIQGQVKRLNVNDIENAFARFEQSWQAHQPQTSKSQDSGPSKRILPPLKHLDLAIQQLLYDDYQVANLKLKAQQPTPDHWTLQLQSPVLAGQLQMKGQSGQAIERLTGRFAYLKWPLESGAPETKAKKSRSDDAPLIDSKHWPVNALDVQINQLYYQDHALGRLNIRGQAQGHQQWHLEHFNLCGAMLCLQTSGDLRRHAQQVPLSLHGQLKIANLGQLLEALDVTEDLAQTKADATLNVQVPDVNDLHLETLDANLYASLQQGRIKAIDSKALQVLQLISLQALSHLPYIASNLRDTLQEGMAFEKVNFNIQLQHQLLSLKQFELFSNVLDARANGQSHLNTQQLDFRAHVKPHMELSGAALATGIVFNPIIGAQALLGQWLLRRPLESALEQDFHIQGTWQKPLLDGKPMQLD
ncbi:YhdP family protein [Brackiella oedipodis]|uniref:YhdP family phospholipid transporter n=1 Tax=Brackiella oedipodis TaxID=124225 RepID=UPI000491DCD0|nr:AsmA-like C-terminal region-containing protein [Brackiella oedipodis]